MRKKPADAPARLSVPASPPPEGQAEAAEAPAPEPTPAPPEFPALGGEYITENGVRRLVRRAGVHPHDLPSH